MALTEFLNKIQFLQPKVYGKAYCLVALCYFTLEVQNICNITVGTMHRYFLNLELNLVETCNIAKYS